MTTVMYNIASGEVRRISMTNDPMLDADSRQYAVIANPTAPDGWQTREPPRDTNSSWGPLHVLGVQKHLDSASNTMRNATPSEITAYGVTNAREFSDKQRNAPPVQSGHQGYATWEAGVLCHNKGTVDGLIGDITTMKRHGQTYALGLATLRNYCWVPITGMDDQSMFDLAGPWEDQDENILAKHRYQIPLGTLGALDTRFDKACAEDQTLCYQPYFNVDELSGWMVTVSPPFDIAGLVYDKQSGAFL